MCFVCSYVKNILTFLGLKYMKNCYFFKQFLKFLEWYFIQFLMLYN